MKYGILYVVTNEGEIVYASTDREKAEGYADTKGYEARQRVLDEWGNDDPDEKDLAEADFQAGFDGDYYDVEAVDITGLTEDSTVQLMDGTEVDVSEILKKLDKDEDDDEYEDEDSLF